MDIFLGVDGTGPINDDTYAKDFASSHVRRMWKEWHSPEKLYRRGPSGEGMATDAIAYLAHNWVREKWTEHQKVATQASPTRVFLSGYSRGGAIVIDVANRLNYFKIPVHAMFLFDAVDRSGLRFVDKIPTNVTACYHAVRSKAAGSREIFGNCGRAAPASVAYTEKGFFCTHGGVGGTPWAENGKSGKIEELNGFQKGLATVFALAKNSQPTMTGLAMMEADAMDYTNVTVEHDKSGSEESWDWMSCNLLQARASCEAAGISSFGVNGKTR